MDSVQREYTLTILEGNEQLWVRVKMNKYDGEDINHLILHYSVVHNNGPSNNPIQYQYVFLESVRDVSGGDKVQSWEENNMKS